MFHEFLVNIRQEVMRAYPVVLFVCVTATKRKEATQHQAQSPLHYTLKERSHVELDYLAGVFTDHSTGHFCWHDFVVDKHGARLPFCQSIRLH